MLDEGPQDKTEQKRREYSPIFKIDRRTVVEMQGRVVQDRLPVAHAVLMSKGVMSTRYPA